MSAKRKSKEGGAFKNAKSGLLTQQENQKIFESLGTNANTLSTTVVQVYLAYPTPTKWTKNCCGVACFVKDFGLKSYYIRVYDGKNWTLLWEQELHNKFVYKTPRSFFHTFETDDCHAALNFASESEAENFKAVINDRLQKKHDRKTIRKSRSSANEEPPPLPSGHPSLSNQKPTSQPPVIDVSVQQSVASKKDSTETVVGKKASGKKGSNKKSKKDKKLSKKLSKLDIGGPCSFTHVGHVGWNPQTGLDASKLDPDLKAMLKSAGVTEKQLQDKETSKFVFDFIQKRGGIEAVKKDQEKQKRRTDPLPPLPPPSHGSAPTPPPPAQLRPPEPLPTRPTPSTQPPSRAGPRTAKPPMAIPKSHRPTSAEVDNKELPPPPLPDRQSSYRNRRNQPPAASLPLPPPPEPDPTPVPPPVPPSHSAAVPPPPPPGIPPPPPILTNDVDLSSGTQSSSRGGLLDQIQQGTTLRTVDHAERTTPSSDGRGDLLSQIRQGIQLKTVEPSETLPSTTEEPEGLAGALAKALANRSNAIRHSSEEEDFDEEDEFEDDWSD
ncbi:actin nucleation-promoting factor WASL-like [Ptychodera flava]|uniref:actin nucleation-promoting factor WASL-like n=1 Tax=Ptychodera flava TaxID=63121 RepID=UPI00396A132C